MGAQPGPYQQFLDYMNAKSGRIFEIEFYQEQFGKRFESNGTFFYLGKKHYTFDALDQRITFNNGEITTINKVEKQVIYDQTIPGEVTIFDILTGTNKSLQTGEPLLEKNGFRIPFTLLDWEMHGTIAGIFLLLSILAKILSLASIKGRDVAAIDLTNYETIDLRE